MRRAWPTRNWSGEINMNLAREHGDDGSSENFESRERVKCGACGEDHGPVYTREGDIQSHWPEPSVRKWKNGHMHDCYYSDYRAASRYLARGRSGTRRTIANNTDLLRASESVITVRLHATDIVTLFADGDISFDTNGWRTHTTRERLQRVRDYSFHSERVGDITHWVVQSDRLARRVDVNVRRKFGLPTRKEQAYIGYGNYFHDDGTDVEHVMAREIGEDAAHEILTAYHRELRDALNARARWVFKDGIGFQRNGQPWPAEVQTAMPVADLIHEHREQVKKDRRERGRRLAYSNRTVKAVLSGEDGEYLTTAVRALGGNGYDSLAWIRELPHGSPIVREHAERAIRKYVLNLSNPLPTEGANT